MLASIIVLQILLEYQFTCHAKFKSAVNALSCKDLRLDPIGRDKNGCVYWLQVDEEANLCLYKEDPDEETWQLIARYSYVVFECLIDKVGMTTGLKVCYSSLSVRLLKSKIHEIIKLRKWGLVM